MSDLPEKTILETDLPGAISRRTGKVRDIYDYGDCLLIVVTDRISAFDCVMPNGIPGKGKVLTALSKFWFDQTAAIIPNHVLSTEVSDFPPVVQPYAEILAGRTMMVKKAEVVPIECVVRGYLAGSGWKSYQAGGEVCGHRLPPGLVESDRLPEPLFTPSTKAESGHDENISCAQAAEIVGTEMASALQDTSLALYNFAAEYLASRRLIIADTKYEFGLFEGQLIVIDEMMTPDSSRYWDADKYQPGRGQESIDKQYVRDYLETLDWNKEPPAPVLPPQVVAETRRIYEEALRRVTG
ncbi:MAG TPA: phosphoribosylaminoimidazolesuccinocarboxamide synthase [Armatimonadota bacterium]|jgi:phosphoribosylaminoimidazole-succinocarboxamide synthase